MTKQERIYCAEILFKLADRLKTFDDQKISEALGALAVIVEAGRIDDLMPRLVEILAEIMNDGDFESREEMRDILKDAAEKDENIKKLYKASEDKDWDDIIH